MLGGREGVTTLGLDKANVPADVLIYLLKGDLERVMRGRQAG